jgi:hypothetical protein
MDDGSHEGVRAFLLRQLSFYGKYSAKEDQAALQHWQERIVLARFEEEELPLFSGGSGA